MTTPFICRSGPDGTGSVAYYPVHLVEPAQTLGCRRPGDGSLRFVQREFQVTLEFDRRLRLHAPSGGRGPASPALKSRPQLARNLQGSSKEPSAISSSRECIDRALASTAAARQCGGCELRQKLEPKRTPWEYAPACERRCNSEGSNEGEEGEPPKSSPKEGNSQKVCGNGAKESDGQGRQ